MKLLQKLRGSVQSCGFATTSGNLLFISHKEVLVTAGDDGTQLSFHQAESEVNCIAAAENEPHIVVGYDWGFQLFRLVPSQATCRSISRILDKQVSPKEASMANLECQFSLETPVHRIAISRNGGKVAVFTSPSAIKIYQLFYTENAKIESKLLFGKVFDESENLADFGFADERLFIVRGKIVSIYDDTFSEIKVTHPGKVDHIDFHLDFDGSFITFLTISNNILRIWKGKGDRFELVSSKNCSREMSFSFLNNKTDDTDFLVGIEKGNLHLWSVSNLSNDKATVVISTLRMIPNVYPNPSTRIKMKFQIRPFMPRMSELPLRRTNSMFSLSPSITNSIQMATVGASQKIFVDVVDSEGNLVTLTLSSSTNSFGDTTSVKHICQASGHPTTISSIDVHPTMPLLVTSDELGYVFIMRRLIDKLEHNFVKKYGTSVHVKWLAGGESNKQCFAVVQSSGQNIIVTIRETEGKYFKQKENDYLIENFNFENIKRVIRHGENLLIVGDRYVVLDPKTGNNYPFPISSEPLEAVGLTNNLFVCKNNSELSIYDHETCDEICKPLKTSKVNQEICGPGIILSWSLSGGAFTYQLDSCIHTGFEFWECLDTGTFEIPLECRGEKAFLQIFENENLTSQAFLVLGRTVFTINIFQRSGPGTLEKSEKGFITQSGKFTTSGSLKRPTAIERIDIKHFVIVCGKSLLLVESEVFWSRPVYSPVNLEKIINLGKVTLAKKILNSISLQYSKTTEFTKDKLWQEIFPSTNVKELEPVMPSLSFLLNDGFNIILDKKRRKSIMDEDTIDNEKRLSLTIDEELKLDFGSSDSEEEEEEYDIDDLTLSDILMRYRLVGINRAEQVTLEAIWECLNTVIPAGIDRAGTTFMLQWHHHRCITKYQRKSKVEDAGLPSTAMIWAFHSDSQAEIISIVMESPQFCWDLLKLTGAPLWCKETHILRTSVEKLARHVFQKEKDPMPAVVWYCILRKEKVLGGLFKSVNNLKMASFFGNDFTDNRWKQAALKNAFALLGKRRYFDAIGFFLLGGALDDALDVALNRLNDKCLTLLIARLYSGQSLFIEKLKHIAASDIFITSILHWVQGQVTDAVNIFLDPNVSKENDPAKIFNFHKFLSKHPLYVKALTLENSNSKRETTQERILCSRAAFAHITSGCPLPALIVLEHMPQKKINEQSDNTVTSEQSFTMDMNWAEPGRAEEETLDLQWSDDDDSDDESSCGAVLEAHSDESVQELVDYYSHEITGSSALSYLLQNFGFSMSTNSSEPMVNIVDRFTESQTDLRAIWPGLPSTFSLIDHVRKNRVNDLAAPHAALSLKEKFDFPLLSLVQAKPDRYFSTDLDHIRYYFELILSEVAKYSTLPSYAVKITSRTHLKNLYQTVNMLFDRLIPRQSDAQRAEEPSTTFWPLNRGGFEATKLVLEFTSITIVTFLVIALLETRQLFEVRVLNRLSVSQFHSKKFLVKAFGVLSADHEFESPREDTHIINLLLKNIKDRHQFFEGKYEEYDDEGFDEYENEYTERSSFFPRFTRVVCIVIIQQRLTELNRMVESNLMKRIEDILKKWSFDEFDMLSDTELPLVAIPNYSQDMSLESINPFCSSGPITKELSMQWNLLSKMQILKPIFQQFVFEKIAIQNREEYEEISSNHVDVLRSSRVSYVDPEVVCSVTSSSILPKATTLSLLYPLQQDSDDNTISSLKTESQQVAISNGKEIIEFYPLIGNSKLEVRSRRQIRDVRRLSASPSDPMVYAAGSAFGDVYLIEFASTSVTRILNSKESKSRIKCLVFSSSGSRLAALGEDGSARIWVVDQILHTRQAVPPVQRFNIGRDVLSICFMEGSSELISVGVHKNNHNRALCIWDLLTRQYLEPVFSLELHEIGGSASAVTYAQKFQLICIGGKDGGLVFVDKDYLVVSSISFTGMVKCLSISDDEEFLAVGSTDGSVRVCSLSQQSLIVVLNQEHPRPSVFKNPTAGVMGVSFCGDYLLSCGADGKLKKRHYQSLVEVPSTSNSLSPMLSDDCPLMEHKQ